MNEELRSSAEELETSKEELQSLNEELRTVNQELKIKIEEQTQANDDIQNLINSTEIGSIFLDRASRIKLFTPRARDIFTLIAADRGRPLSDINSALVGIDIQPDVEHVLERLDRVEREVRTRDDRWYLMRVLPYRTADDRIDGVVVTFVDITERRRVEEEAREFRDRLRLVVDSIAEYAIFTVDASGRIDSWNPGAARAYGYTEDQVLGSLASILYTPDDREQHIDEQELRRADQTGRALDERWHVRRDGSRFFASGVVSPLRDSNGATIGYVKIARDLTERKQWEDALQRAHGELEVRVRQRTSELADANQRLDSQLQERSSKEDEIRGLVRRLLTVQEDERQQLTALKLKIDALGGAATDQQIALVEDVQRAMSRFDEELDFFTRELRPAALDDLGLAVTLRHFIAEWSHDCAIAADFQSRGVDDLSVPRDIATNLYRIAQEALNNVCKHARATHAAVILERRGGELVLVVEDNGVGFAPGTPDGPGKRPGGVGLLGMEERAKVVGGSLEIESSGSGTTVFVKMPLHEPH
jgi:PAS domain S-box-containing protein